jgi:FkbM family methyltransferase
MNSYKNIYYPEVAIKEPVIKSILSGRNWENNIIEIFNKYVKQGDVVVDAGAYIGTHTIHLSRLVGEDGTVITIEPINLIVECLSKTIQARNLNNVELVPMALSDEDNLVKTYTTRYDGKSSNILNRRKNLDKLVDVETITIDTLCKDFNELKLMKIDVEGSEWEALAGAKKTIRKMRPIIILETWKNKTNMGKLQDWCYLNKYTYEELVMDNYLLIPKLL